MRISELPIEEIDFEDMPNYFRRRNTGNTYIMCGPAKTGGNEPYCYVEEKQCAGHVCRVMCPEKVFDRATLLRDDGTVWTVWLSNFQDVRLLKISGDAVLPGRKF